MKDRTRQWIKFAEENLEAAKILLLSHLFNPCLHNIQQAVEKYLKALFVEFLVDLVRTHNIHELVMKLEKSGIKIEISEDECDFLDSIYLPTKYPMGSALPHFEPGEKICSKGLKIAVSVCNSVKRIINSSADA